MGSEDRFTKSFQDIKNNPKDDIKMIRDLKEESVGTIEKNVNVDETARTKVTSRRTNPLFLLLRIRIESLVSCCLLSLLLVSVSAHKEQRFAIEPQDQSAVVGSRVTLPCRVENKVGQLQWTKDDFGLGTHRYLTGYDRYKMIGSDEEGDYSLDIKEVTLDDDALYQCQVSSGPR
ncbi:hypothetical protein ACJJTC_011441, partial [Scirpophaga incertulas]